MATSNKRAKAGQMPYAGKNLRYYNGRSKRLPTYEEGNSSSSSDEEDEEEDDDMDQNDSADSDATEDGFPVLKNSIIVDNDEEEEDDDDEEDEDSDSDLTDSEIPKRIIKTPVKNLQIPKRLDIASIRRQKSETPSNESNESESQEESELDENEHAIASDSEEEEFEISARKMFKGLKNNRSTSVIDNDFDDRLAFPRSEMDHVEQAEDFDNYDDYDNESLLAMLGNGNGNATEYDQETDYDAYVEVDEDEPEYDEDEEYDEEEDDDDSQYDYDNLDDAVRDDDEKMEAQEEKAIMDEMKEKDLFSNTSSPGPFYDTEEFGFEEDEDEDESFFIDDFFEHTDITPQAPTEQSKHIDGDDDTYLWSYFFSSGESDDDDSHINNSISNGNSLILPPEVDGEETDVDLSIPRSSHRKSAGRATEVLSSSNTASRPPTLGVWVMSDERPFGIIDGLSTRTLSPPSQQELRRTTSFVNNSRKRAWNQVHDNDSEASELALDEFIYTSDLDDRDDDDEQQTPMVHYNSNIHVTPVPLSAFRNRGVVAAVGPHHVPTSHKTRRSSSMQRNRKDAVITPVKSMQKRLQKRKKQRRRLHHDNIDNDLHDDPVNGEHWNELVEMGALSPLFAGIS